MKSRAVTRELHAELSVEQVAISVSLRHRKYISGATIRLGAHKEAETEAMARSSVSVVDIHAAGPLGQAGYS